LDKTSGYRELAKEDQTAFRSNDANPNEVRRLI